MPAAASGKSGEQSFLVHLLHAELGCVDLNHTAPQLVVLHKNLPPSTWCDSLAPDWQVAALSFHLTNSAVCLSGI